MAKTLDVAVIGYGLGGSAFHAPVIASVDGLNLKAIVTSNQERQAKAKSDFPGVEIIADSDQLWSKSFDLVVITTPNKFHAPLATKALQSGMAAVIDKPIAVSVDETKRLIETSKSTGKLLCAFQNRRWDNDFLTIRKLIDANKFGQIWKFESRYERFRAAINQQAWRETAKPDEAGGLLFDLGSHLIDQALCLFGTPTHVYCELNSRRPGASADDEVFVALNFANQVTAHLSMTLTSRIAGPRFLINGELGSYEKFGLDPQEDCLRSGQRPTNGNWGKEPKEKWGTFKYEDNGVAKEEKIESTPGAYQEFYKQIYEAIVNGSEVPVDPHESLRVMQVIEAAQQSARAKQVIDFKA